jgi:hypothetical protein
MCQFKSAIVLENGDIIHHNLTQSHEDLIDLYNLKDNGNGKFVRVEFTSDTLHIIESYRLKVDENTTPDWFEQYRENTERYLLKYVKNHIIDSDRNILLGDTYIICKNAEVKTIKSAVIENVRDSAVIRNVSDSAVIKNVSGSAVIEIVWGSAVIKIVRDSAVIEIVSGSAVIKNVSGSAVIKIVRDSAVIKNVSGSAVIENVWDSAVIKNVSGSAVIENVSGSAVIENVWDSAVIKNVSGSAVIKNDKRNNQQ